MTGGPMTRDGEGSAQRLPRISVVTPSFNQRDYVDTTLTSVLDQHYPELEYVVIDGGSTDGSVDVIRRHEDRLAYWVSEPDGGHADALNKGFARTSGEIMCWINSSDMYFPWTLSVVAQIFTALPQVEWIMGVPSEFDDDGYLKNVRGGFTNAYDILAGHSRSIQQESCFWRRRLWDRAGGCVSREFKRAADFELWLRFLRLTPLCHVQTVLGGFRVHEDRLGDAGGGHYQREMDTLLARFRAEQDKRTLRRARMVKTIGQGRRKVVGQALHRAGAWPWYRHPRIFFDFDTKQWMLR